MKFHVVLVKFEPENGIFPFFYANDVAFGLFLFPRVPKRTSAQKVIFHLRT